MLDPADPLFELVERHPEGDVAVRRDLDSLRPEVDSSVKVVDASSWQGDAASSLMLLTSRMVSLGLERASTTKLAFPST